MAIDFHAHIITPEYKRGLKTLGIDSLAVDGFPLPDWSAEKHLGFMREAGIERSILSSPTPHLWGDDKRLTARVHREVNASMAEVCKKYPDEFSFVASVPLPYIDKAVEEYRFAVNELGAVGVKLTTHTGEVYLGDPSLDELMAELNRDSALVIIHPERAAEYPKTPITGTVAAIFEYPTDTTRAVLNMIAHKVMTRFPFIRFVVPHTGSFLPYMLQRFTGVSGILASMGMMEQVDVQREFQNLYFDTAGDPEPVALDMLLSVAGEEKIVYGSDFPHSPAKVVLAGNPVRTPSTPTNGELLFQGWFASADATSLGDSVFNNCGSLDSFTVASGNAAYSGEGNNLIDRASHTIIRGTNNSEIPSTVTGIGVAAFRRANAITELYIPRSVTSIEKYAFAYSTITTIEYEGSEDDWETVSKGTMWDLHCTLEIKYNVERDKTAKILVAYFSATGHTETAAGYIAELTGGTEYEIEPEVPYTQADLNYGSSSSRTSSEDKDPSARPAISGSVADMESYDVVFLGYPIWFGSAPKIIYTFLESYDFSGKTIIPFCTSASSGIGSSASNLHSLASGATWLSGTRFASNASKSDVETWLNGLEY